MKNIYYRFFYLLLLSNSAVAYQEPTHIIISEASVDSSVLNTSNILGDIGLILGVNNEQEKSRGQTR